MRAEPWRSAPWRSSGPRLCSVKAGAQRCSSSGRSSGGTSSSALTTCAAPRECATMRTYSCSRRSARTTRASSSMRSVRRHASECLAARMAGMSSSGRGNPSLSMRFPVRPGPPGPVSDSSIARIVASISSRLSASRRSSAGVICSE
eukprot:Amastigsp_a340982_24.p4 type:complete len:147 gc:universal Amastigsp_a340982_24:458-18(-)